MIHKIASKHDRWNTVIPKMQQSDPLAPSTDARATWVLSDGRAGNHRQAQALATTLGRAYTDRLIHPTVPWRWAAPRVLPFSTKAFAGPVRHVLEGREPAPQLVIGCGRQAALATRLLRRRGSHVIQILDPRVNLSAWDAVILPHHDRREGPNVVRIHGALHSMSPAALDAARSTFSTTLGSLSAPRIAVLLGGDTHKRPFDAEQALQAVQALASLGSLMVSTSRRTPAAVAAQLRTLPVLRDHLLWTGEADAQHAAAHFTNPYAGYLAWADAIVCSADSVSMLSEAAATTAPLYLLGTPGDDAPSRFAEELVARGRAQWWSAESPAIAMTPVAPFNGLQTLLTDLRQTPAFAR